jgi:hypothetical protein
MAQPILLEVQHREQVSEPGSGTASGKLGPLALFFHHVQHAGDRFSDVFHQGIHGFG